VLSGSEEKIVGSRQLAVGSEDFKESAEFSVLGADC